MVVGPARCQVVPEWAGYFAAAWAAALPGSAGYFDIEWVEGQDLTLNPGRWCASDLSLGLGHTRCPVLAYPSSRDWHPVRQYAGVQLSQTPVPGPYPLPGSAYRLSTGCRLPVPGEVGF